MTVSPIADQSPWVALTHQQQRRQSLHDVIGALVDDDTLKLSLRQAHWELFDPWLDAGARYVPEQPNGGRHRFEMRPGAWFVCAAPTPLDHPGRHACHCADCRHEPEPATQPAMGPLGYDPDCDGCNAPGGPSPEHTARHYREAAQW